MSGLILLFIIAPLLGMVLHTSPDKFMETASDREVQDSIWLTLKVSFLGTLFFAFGSIPLAWLLARKEFPGKKIVQGIVDIPIVLPHTAAGIALLGTVSRDGVLGKMASAIGLDLVSNPVGIALAMAFVSVPFMINSARDGFSQIPERLEKTAMNLGAGPARVFFSISVPLAWRSIISGFIMMFARGMSEFGAVVVIAYHPMIAPVLIYERFTSYGLAYARPAAVLFILVALAVFILFRMISVERSESKTGFNAED